MQECVSVSKCSSTLLLWKYSRLGVLSPRVEMQLLPNSGECLICAAKSHILFGIHISDLKPSKSKYVHCKDLPWG